MSRLIKSSDVLDANAVTKVDLRGELIGRFEPTGPNKWDDWELTADDVGEVVEIPAENKLQVEPLGAEPEIRLRFRDGRRVLRLRWLPSDKDLEAISTGKWGVQESKEATFMERVLGLGPKDDPRDDLLEYFLDQIAEPYSPENALGIEAMLIKKLRGL